MMRVYSVLLAGLVVSVAAAVPAVASTGSSLLDDARALAAKGDAKSALIQFKRAVKEDPTNPEARYELGVVEFRMGDMVAAERDLTIARDNKYPIAKVNPLLAVVLLTQGKIPQLLSTVAPCPDDAQCRSEVLAVHARAHLSTHSVDAADADSKGAIEAVPTNASAQVVRALVLMAKSDYLAAEALIDSALGAKDKLPEALTLKGDLRRQANDLESAVKYYKEALTISARDITIRQRLALALAALGRNDEAQTEVNQVLQQAPQAVVAVYLKALLEVRNGKTADAMETIRPVESSITQIPRGIFLLAVIHAANDHLEQALDYATKFHTLEPDNLVSAKLLASIYFRTRAYNRVIATLAPLQDRLAEDAEALGLLGSAYMAEGWIKEANEVLTKVTKVQPNDVMSQARLAVNQTRDASTREAGIRELETLVAANPQNFQIDLALLFSYVAAKDFNHAIETATKMMTVQPDSPLPPTVRGATYLATGNDAAAKADFELALSKNRDFIPAASYLAELAMRGDDFARARKIIDDLLDRNQSDLRVLMARVRIEARANQLAAMLPFLRTAISAHPEEPEPRIQLIQALVGLGQVQDAGLAVDDLVRTQPRNPAAIDMAARTLLSLKKNDEGIKLYQKLQNDFPNSPQIHERLAQALLAVGRSEEARTALDRATSADRTYLSAWINRAMLELRLSGFDAAKDIANKALSQNPQNDNARVLTADLLVAAKRFPEAEAAYTAVLAQSPSSIAINHLYRAIILQGDRPRAQKVALEWLAKHPDDHTIRMIMAEGVLAAGDYKSAAAQYELLSSKLPDNPTILNNLAWSYDRLDDARAIDVARRAHALLPSSSEILDTYAYLLYRKADAKLGAELERRAYTGAKKNPQIVFHMARILADAKDTAGALALLKPLIEAKTAFAEAEDAHQLYTKLGGL